MHASAAPRDVSFRLHVPLGVCVVHAFAVLLVPLPVQSLRPQFQRYLKHVQLALEDGVAVSIVRGAGILMDGSLRTPLSTLATAFPPEASSPAARLGFVRDAAADSVDAQWNTKTTLEILNVVRTDIGRLDGPLRELRPKDRCGRIVVPTGWRKVGGVGDGRAARSLRCGASSGRCERQEGVDDVAS